jgi:DNA-binding response OmpR family regulator
LLLGVGVMNTPESFAEPPWRSALTAAPIHDPPRILVAEDDSDMRQLVVDALRKDGYDVAAIPDGGRLLVTLAHQFVDENAELSDLLVSDVWMPVCSGMQILEQMRAAHWRIPVILMTAFGDPAAREHARTLGALLFDKPFDVDDLRTAAAALLQRGPASLTARSARRTRA